MPNILLLLGLLYSIGLEKWLGHSLLFRLFRARCGWISLGYIVDSIAVILTQETQVHEKTKNAAGG